ncbi:MAG: HAMP domain-containing sensor histidine kinase [Thermodesulfobacteriota bacterium]
MKKRSVFLYWGLLLIPTVIIGVAGIRLLSSEQERWDQMERASALERARAIAQGIQLTVEGVQHEITEGLTGIRRQDLLDTLLAWERENPSIRNIFVWQPKVGLKYPIAGEQASAEQMRFMLRYQSLFLGRPSWQPDGSGIGSDPSISTGTDQKPSKGPQVREEISDGQLLQRSISRPPARQPYVQQQAVSQPKYGWIPWFADNRLHLLGWIQRGPSDVVYGVELETVSLISLLIEKFPKSEVEGITYALLDDAGRLVHQLGRSPIRAKMIPALDVSLAPHLPHWRVAVFLDPKGASLRSGNAFLIIGGLLLASFIAAILLGGVLLTRQAYAHWQDAMQKSSFVSNVSHELKTPLTTIRMYAELLDEGMVKEPEKKKHYLQVIVSEAERLSRLVNNVLGFSRLEQGRMNYRIQEIDVAEFMRSFLDTNEMRLRESGMSITAQIPEPQLLVQADRDALEHTFLNILDNAIKYASEGGSLEINVSATDSMCEIRFRDHGPGIPVSHREKIFEKFQRVDDSLTAGKIGTGLGLTIARRMMRDLGGDVVYRPDNEGGSCFVVSVPLATALGGELA